MYDDAKQLSEITLLAFLTYRNSISAVTETRQSPQMEKIYFFLTNNSELVSGNALFQSIIYKMEIKGGKTNSIFFIGDLLHYK